MDPSILVSTIVAFLAPILPYLYKAGEAAAAEASKQFGAAAWDKAKALWDKLWPKVEGKPAAQEAVQDVTSNPEDEDAQAALRLQVKKLLAEDASLAQAIAALVEEGQRAGIITIAAGDRSVAVGRDVTGSTIITGNGNK